MNKEIIIREKKIDWLEIINLALNRTGWGKKHTIYTTGKLTVNAEIATMNFKSLHWAIATGGLFVATLFVPY